MTIERYLAPISPADFGYRPSDYAEVLGDNIQAYTPGSPFPELPNGGLVLLGVGDDRGSIGNAGCADAPDIIRTSLYNLAIPDYCAHLTDLGNIIPGQLPEDTCFAVAEVVAALLDRHNTVLLLGGSQDLTFAAYKAYETLHRIINIAAIDPRFDVEETDENSSRSWLRTIIMQNPNYLFLHTNVGYQTYFVGRKMVQLMDDLKFDAFRLGEVQRDMARAEALLRNADLVSVDISAVRQSDAPGCGTPSPHGFYGEELCQMMRFAGMSDKASCLGLFDVNPRLDRAEQTTAMAAQALWHFIEGFFNRRPDNPRLNPENSKRYLVRLEDHNLQITFYKSKLSDRWWVEVPCHDPDKCEIYSPHLMLPCTYSDYQQAMNNEIPALWWNYFQRVNSPL